MENYKPRHAKNGFDLIESFNNKELRMLRVSLMKDVASRKENERFEEYFNLLYKVENIIKIIKD